MRSNIGNTPLATGAGSGLDADKLDNVEGAVYARKDIRPDFSAGARCDNGTSDTPEFSWYDPINDTVLYADMNAEKWRTFYSYRGAATLVAYELNLATRIWDFKAWPTVNGGDIAAFTKPFISPAQTIVSAGLLTIAHGMGVAPKLFQMHIKCLTAEDGWAIGDEMEVGYDNSTAGDNRFLALQKDATNIKIRFTNKSNVFHLANKTTGVSTTFTNANWEFYVRAYG